MRSIGPAAGGDAPKVLRRLLLAVLTLGLLGTGAELVAFDHFEDVWQAIPIGLILVALAVVFWNATAVSPASVRAMQLLMGAFVAAGLLGIYLHYVGNLEFQLEMDPSQSRWALFTNVIQAKAPPSLAPGTTRSRRPPAALCRKWFPGGEIGDCPGCCWPPPSG